MSASNKFAGILAVSALCVGCAEVRPGHAPSQVEREAAYALVDQLVSLAAQPNDAHELVAALSMGPVVTLTTPAGTLLSAPTQAPVTRDLGDCLITTKTSITYTECEVGGHLVEGTWSAQSTQVHATLADVFVAGPGSHGFASVDATLASETELSGMLDLDLMWTAESNDYSLDALIRADSIVVERPGCVSSGTLTVTSRFGGAPASTTTLWFGPGCSDLSVSP